MTDLGAAFDTADQESGRFLRDLVRGLRFELFALEDRSLTLPNWQRTQRLLLLELFDPRIDDEEYAEAIGRGTDAETVGTLRESLTYAKLGTRMLEQWRSLASPRPFSEHVSNVQAQDMVAREMLANASSGSPEARHRAQGVLADRMMPGGRQRADRVVNVLIQAETLEQAARVERLLEGTDLEIPKPPSDGEL